MVDLERSGRVQMVSEEGGRPVKEKRRKKEQQQQRKEASAEVGDRSFGRLVNSCPASEAEAAAIAASAGRIVQKRNGPREGNPAIPEPPSSRDQLKSPQFHKRQRIYSEWKATRLPILFSPPSDLFLLAFHFPRSFSNQVSDPSVSLFPPSSSCLWL